MKTKYMVLAILIVSVIVLAGCGEKTVYEDSDSEVVVDNGDNTVTSTIKSDDGEQTTVVTGTTGEDSWCAEGSKWVTEGAEGSAEMIVQGIMKTGKYAGFCHITYDIDAEGSEANMDVYFDEEGNGYQVMEVAGQTFETEWTG
ncbi:MAG: hypothetical protein U9R08_04675 [Nanoarchaeota archaeon]|nr:hypothetical protein [Nanoarchaeota archaeon]